MCCLVYSDVTLTSGVPEVECEDGSMVEPLSVSFVVASGLPLPPYLPLYLSVSLCLSVWPDTVNNLHLHQAEAV